MQTADLSSNFFVLFGLPVSFEVDLKLLAERYREMQRAVHPDKFANAVEAERRLSMQMAARLNEGLQVLKDPLARGRYLLELRGVELDDNGALDGAFLMEQMELRERLGEVKGSDDPHQQLHAVAQDIAARSKELVAQLAAALQQDSDESLQMAKDLTRKLQFFRRLEEEVVGLEDDLAAV